MLVQSKRGKIRESRDKHIGVFYLLDNIYFRFYFNQMECCFYS